MTYIVKSSEKLRQSGAEGETKALLYLMNLRKDSNQIYYFIVDFFNDLTGMDRYSEKLWDVQSKSAKNNSAKAIGKELVTLFKNFISEFKFNDYILFVGGVANSFRIDNNITTFGIENIKKDAKEKMIVGLKEEAKIKTYIDNTAINDKQINEFLQKVTFVIDDKESFEYIKLIIKNHPKIMPNNDVLQSIFNEIRNKQSEKKNSQVENKTICSPDQALNFCRHLTTNEIRLLTLQRIINRNPVEKGIPKSFVPTYNSWPPEKNSEMLEECQQSMCRALFNKNASDAFWTLFENVYDLILQHQNYTVDKIFQSLDSDVKSAVPDLDVFSLKYFIANVKDGI